MKPIIDIQAMFRWSAPIEVNTKNGKRLLSKCTPDSIFWNLWRTSKEDLKAIGISLSKGNSDTWEVCWWQPLPTTTPEPTKPQEDKLDWEGRHMGSDDIAFFKPAATKATGNAKNAEVTPKRETSTTPGNKWSAEQEAIFTWFRKPSKTSRALVVRARAGTGKTTTIKAAFSQAPEERMLYCVFNKKNQREAQEKILDTRVDVRTLHSLGYMYILEVWKDAKPVDSVEQDRIVAATTTDVPGEVAGAIGKLVGYAKNVFVGLPAMEELMDIADERDIETPGFAQPENGGYTVTKLCACALKVLELSKEKDAQGRISFNDMVWLPVAMNWVRSRFDLVVVDEAQDMNAPQLLMAQRAAKANGRICVVGDDRQAIYGFRGAVQDGLNMMKERLKADELGLTTTYRCPKSVVTLAAQLVPDYKAASTTPEGLVENAGEAGMLATLVPGNAVLSRINAPLMSLCLALLRKGTPARIEGRDLGRALVTLMKKFNAKSVPHFLERVDAWLARGIKRATKSKHAETKCAALRDQADTLTAVAEGCSSVKEIETRLMNLFQDSDKASRPAVVLSSVHKAKGLEWDKVYLLHKTFRHQLQQLSGLPGFQPNHTEEDNIYYVAVTRAKHHLVLVEGDGSSFRHPGERN